MYYTIWMSYHIIMPICHIIIHIFHMQQMLQIFTTQ
jgi:hypothetical protein